MGQKLDRYDELKELENFKKSMTKRENVVKNTRNDSQKQKTN